MKMNTLLVAVALTFFVAVAQAVDVVPYSPAKFAEAKLAGNTVALHFFAAWCPTCRAQQKVTDELRMENKLPVTIFVVDYDHEQALREKLNVRTQSTMIVYKGKEEKARLAGETDPAKIRAALQAGL